MRQVEEEMLSNELPSHRRKVSAGALATIKTAEHARHQLPSLFASALATIKTAELASHQLPRHRRRVSASALSTIKTAELARHFCYIRSKVGEWSTPFQSIQIYGVHSFLPPFLSLPSRPDPVSSQPTVEEGEEAV